MWVSGGHHSPDVMSFYLGLSSGELTNISSHTSARWYLPIFPLRDGSLTLISIASFMALAYAKIFQRQFMTNDVMMVMDG